MIDLRTIAPCLAVSLILVACSSASTNISPSPPPPPPPPPPPAAQHLYVGQNEIPGSIRVYELPLSASSTPVATVPMNAAALLAVNSTTLVVTRITDYSISFFTLPLTSASVPYATIVWGAGRGAATPLFLPSGALYLSGRDTVNVYTPPFTSTSVPSSKIPTPNFAPNILAIGPDGAVYGPLGNVIAVLVGGAVTTRLTAPAGTGFGDLSASATQLFVCEATGSAYSVYIYSLPLTASATPAVILNPRLTSPTACVLDASGNLYVAAGSQIAVFAPPFTTTSTHALLMAGPSGIGAMAIGP